MSAPLSLPSGWVETTFGAVVTPVSVNDKKLPRGEYLESGRYPVVDQGQQLIGGYSNDEDRVVSEDLPLLIFGDHTRAFKYLDQPFVPGADGVKVLKPRGVNAKWLYQIAHALDFPDKGYARHYQHLRSARLLVPPLPEQQRIVAEIEKQLTRLEVGVAALRRVQANLKRYRAAVLKAACEGRLVPTGLEWPHKQLMTVIQTMDQGWSPKCEGEPSNSNTTWAVIKTTAIQHLRFLEGENKMLPATLKPREHLELRPGDLLVTRAGPRSRVGVACLIKITRPRLMLCDKAYRLRCRSNIVHPAFLELILNAPHILYEVNKLKTGISDSGVNLTQKRFGELHVPLPSLVEQARVVAEVERRLSVVEELETVVIGDLQRASRLRQSILQRAFSGEL